MSRSSEQRTDGADDAATVVDALGNEPGSADLAVPHAIGRYVVIERLGAGAMGVVLRAFDSKLRREVALKLVHPKLGDRGGEATTRLLREAQSLAQLSHRNVVAVYDAEATDHGVCLAMEYIEGSDLRQWLKEGPRDWRDVVDVGRGIALGLAGGPLGGARAP